MSNYFLFCRVYTLFKLTLLFVFLLNTECAQDKDEAKVTLKALRPYNANLTCVIQGYFASYFNKLNNIESPVLSTESEPDVKWSFQLFRRKYDYETEIKLHVRSLPSNVAGVSGLVKCGLVVDGRKKFDGRFSEPYDHGVYFGPHVARIGREDGDLTIYCDVKGFLYHHEIAKNQENSTFCANEISNDTIEKLRQFVGKQGDIELESSSKRFHCQCNIFKDRLPLFNLTATNEDQNQTIVYDMSEHVNAEELEDLVSFMYHGKAANLNRTCRVLYGVASKFGFQCLRIICEDMLIDQVKGTNAKEYLELAEIVKSERLKETAAHCITKPKDDKCLI